MVTLGVRDGRACIIRLFGYDTGPSHFHCKPPPESMYLLCIQHRSSAKRRRTTVHHAHHPAGRAPRGLWEQCSGRTVTLSLPTCGTCPESSKLQWLWALCPHIPPSQHQSNLAKSASHAELQTFSHNNKNKNEPCNHLLLVWQNQSRKHCYYGLDHNRPKLDDKVRDAHHPEQVPDVPLSDCWLAQVQTEMSVISNSCIFCQATSQSLHHSALTMPDFQG